MEENQFSPQNGAASQGRSRKPSSLLDGQGNPLLQDHQHDQSQEQGIQGMLQQPINSLFESFSQAKMEINISPDERNWSAGLGGLFTIIGLKRGGFWGTLLASGGAYLLFRGATGYCPVNQAVGRDTSLPEDKDTNVELSAEAVVNRPVEDVFSHWRKLENLPQLMKHLESVNETDQKHSHWVASPITGLGRIEWDAEIVEERANEFLSWRSLEGADVENAGEVRFERLSDGSTLVRSKITYRPPAAGAGAVVAKLLNPVFKSMVRADMERFKDYVQVEPSAPKTQPSLAGMEA